MRTHITILCIAVIKLPHVQAINRYRWNSTTKNRLPFSLTITLPEPRQARLITRRDIAGRILCSNVSFDQIHT